MVSATKENYYELHVSPFKKVRVFSETNPNLGTVVEVRGRSMKPERPRNPGGFDGLHYSLSHGIDRTLRPTKEEVLPKGHTFTEKMYGLRGSFRNFGRKVTEK